jgi:hypothetical protein
VESDRNTPTPPELSPVDFVGELLVEYDLEFEDVQAKTIVSRLMDLLQSVELRDFVKDAKSADRPLKSLTAWSRPL